ncbi:MAG: hypothetical protein U1A22_01970 [Xanthomonadaceae bacterium]|nr:hypothetical protein [Xanthomonadaceae bacterium]
MTSGSARLLCVALAFVAPVLHSQAIAQPDGSQPEASEPQLEGMSGEQLVAMIAKIDPEYQRQGNGVQFSLRDRPVLLAFDETAGRMRVYTPVAQAGILDQSLMKRMLQANFDSALDARYAIANELVWSVFIHPLAGLNEQRVASGIAQVIVAAETFGTTFTSGAIIYGGGDSNEENRKLLEHLDKLMKPEI